MTKPRHPEKVNKPINPIKRKTYLDKDQKFWIHTNFF